MAARGPRRRGRPGTTPSGGVDTRSSIRTGDPSKPGPAAAAAAAAADADVAAGMGTAAAAGDALGLGLHLQLRSRLKLPPLLLAPVTAGGGGDTGVLCPPAAAVAAAATRPPIGWLPPVACPRPRSSAEVSSTACRSVQVVTSGAPLHTRSGDTRGDTCTATGAAPGEASACPGHPCCSAEQSTSSCC
jgi:hypothetical protein